MLYFQGENRPMWPHALTAAAGVAPASKTSGFIPRVVKCAAATKPTGPAPMTTTGSSETVEISGMMILLLDSGKLIGENRASDYLSVVAMPTKNPRGQLPARPQALTHKHRCVSICIQASRIDKCQCLGIMEM